MEVKYFVIAVVASSIYLLAISFVQATHFSTCSPGCNTTIVWWNDTVNVTGNGSATVSVTARIGGTTVCSTTTGASGWWNCTFTAPQQVGKYNLSVTVGTVTDDSTLTVKPVYGEEPTGTAAKFVLETPSAIQEPSGRIRDVLSRLIISRGPAA